MGFNKYQISKYTVFPLFLSSKNKAGKPVTAKTVPKEIYIVDDLKVKMLIEIDIIISEKIDILISTSTI